MDEVVTYCSASLISLKFFKLYLKVFKKPSLILFSRFLLEFVRPDFLMLRTLAKGLIMWDSVVPTPEWIQSHVPKSMQPHCLVRPVENSNIDYETINQAYCNLIAGAALAMGLRFAGTANNQAFETLFALTKKLMAVSKR